MSPYPRGGSFYRGRGRAPYMDDRGDRDLRSRSQEARWGRDRDERDRMDRMDRYADPNPRRDVRDYRDPPNRQLFRNKLEARADHDSGPSSKEISPPPIAPPTPAYGSIPSRALSVGEAYVPTSAAAKVPPIGTLAAFNDQPPSAGYDPTVPPIGPAKSTIYDSHSVPVGPRAQQPPPPRPSSKQDSNWRRPGPSLTIESAPKFGQGPEDREKEMKDHQKEVPKRKRKPPAVKAVRFELPEPNSESDDDEDMADYFAKAIAGAEAELSKLEKPKLPTQVMARFAAMSYGSMVSLVSEGEGLMKMVEELPEALNQLTGEVGGPGPLGQKPEKQVEKDVEMTDAVDAANTVPEPPEQPEESKEPAQSEREPEATAEIRKPEETTREPTPEPTKESSAADPVREAAQEPVQEPAAPEPEPYPNTEMQIDKPTAEIPPVAPETALPTVEETPETQPAPVPPTDSGYASQAMQEPIEQDVSDTATEYSNASSTTFSRQQSYIRELADDLFSKISSLNADEKTQRRVTAILPELLKAFALKVGHDAPTQMHRDVMAFVHRHRREIATAFTDIGFEQDKVDPKRSTASSDDMNWKDRMSLWFEKGSCEEVQLEEELENPGLDIGPQEREIRFSSPNPAAGDDQPTDEALRGVAETEEYEVPERWLLAYSEFVFSNESYEWLLTRLRREFCLVPTEPNTIQEIRDKIMSSLPSAHRVSRQVSSQSCSARFELDWDILEFFETQGYLNRPDEVFGNVITLTGSCHDAQAATCAQYIRQTWPLTGEAMVQLLKEVLRGGEGHSHLCKLSDGTTLSAWISRPKFVVDAYGVAASIAETGEHFAWLGAALRTSPRLSGLVHCTPIITNIIQNSAPSHQPELQPSSTHITCEIGFTMEEVRQPLSTANGQCWHDIFMNPVVVRGYPIPKRIQWSTGLEISLNIMAGLVRTQRVDRFDDKVYIKGFSAMLIPTRRNEDILCWHLVYNKDGGRISYLDDDLDREQDVTRLNLEDFRHMLGWCSEAKFYAGSKLADQIPVSHSRLPKPHAGCALVNKSVSEGKVISNGSAFELGAKDKPVHVSRSGYIHRLQWMATKFVLLWDEGDKRGWLINGASALLHVVRASLAHDKIGDFSSAFLFESLQESNKPDRANSAIHVLINPNNLRLRLYREKDGYLLLENRIEHFCNILEKLIDHQTKIARDRDVKWSDKPRKYLEGWDFEDLARKRDPLHPRVATLEAGGKAWVDFTRAIQAVTLVGSGFGDIIRPAVEDFCHYWAKLPTKQYYVASCLSDLSEVIKEHGSHVDGHVRLGDNLIWHTPTTIFGTCRCRRGALGQDHCEPVQTLFPSALSGTLGPRRHNLEWEDENDGALIFGHNSKFSWIWGDIGHPQESDLKEATPSSRSAGVDSDSFHDSGIGSTLSESRVSSSSARLMRSPSHPHNHTAMPDSAASISRKWYNRNQYKVGIICALSKELKAVRALFDCRHNILETIPSDSNQYALGKMAQHMVVAACLPDGEYGTNSAAAVASKMSCSFPSIRFCLLVGIAGGVPSEKNDIHLGDVVVSKPTGTCPGVLQYDLGKEQEGRPFESTGSLQRPPRVLTTAISALHSDPDLGSDLLDPHLREIAARMPEYRHPGRERDVLFQIACAACRSQQVRPGGCTHLRQRATLEPVIHYGPIASGNRVVKDAAFRDRLAHEYGVLCFEMEAAGVINTVDCLVIRGICDYCDAQKNDVWQEYAAATAAAYAKLLLGFVARVENASSGGGIGSSCEEPPTKRRKIEVNRIH
ncbi:hypothetical protein ACHAPT_013531 [Fusarium lateritium]